MLPVIARDKLYEDLVLKSNQKQEKMFYRLKSFCCIKYYIYIVVTN